MVFGCGYVMLFVVVAVVFVSVYLVCFKTNQVPFWRMEPTHPNSRCLRSSPGYSCGIDAPPK